MFEIVCIPPVVKGLTSAMVLHPTFLSCRKEYVELAQMCYRLLRYVSVSNQDNKMYISRWLPFICTPFTHSSQQLGLNLKAVKLLRELYFSNRMLCRVTRDDEVQMLVDVLKQPRKLPRYLDMLHVGLHVLLVPIYRCYLDMLHVGLQPWVVAVVVVVAVAHVRPPWLVFLRLTHSPPPLPARAYLCLPSSPRVLFD
jgi:hypothetical protein